MTEADSARATAIEDLHQDRLDALLVRGGFPADLRHALVARTGAAELPWRRPNRTGPQADIHVLGVAATPTFETPGGPPVDAYFTDAAVYDAIYEELGVPARLEALLAPLAGGRPVVRLAHPDGRRFAACTVRALPEGQRIIVHNDASHFQLPVYRDVVAGLDTRASISFLALLQAPEQGGELVLHGPEREDPPARKIAMAADDLLLFAAGRLYHQVAPVIGARPRITLGGFLTLDREHRRVVYWN